VRHFLKGARWCALFLFAIATALPLRPEMPPWRAQPQTNVLGFGSLRPDPAMAAAPEEGTWDVSITLSESNLWAHSWHTFASHRENGRFGMEIAPEQLRGIEESFPGDAAWHVDVEAWRADIVLARGLPHGLAVALKIPWIGVGKPRWDTLAEGFHDLFGLETVERDLFPANETLIYLKSRGNERIVEGRRELNGSGFGDASLAVSVPLGRFAGGTHRAAVTVELPTGDHDTLRGSGGVDAGASWSGSWSKDRRNLSASAGYTRLDPGGSFLGLARSRDLLHLGAGIDQRLWRNLWGTFSVRFDSSPLGEVIEGYPGNPSTYYRVGFGVPTRYGWLFFDLGEELQPVTGLEADWSFHLTWSARSASNPRP
jgi:hypothetical protein